MGCAGGAKCCSRRQMRYGCQGKAASGVEAAPPGNQHVPCSFQGPAQPRLRTPCSFPLASCPNHQHLPCSFPPAAIKPAGLAPAPSPMLPAQTTSTYTPASFPRPPAHSLHSPRSFLLASSASHHHLPCSFPQQLRSQPCVRGLCLRPRSRDCGDQVGHCRAHELPQKAWFSR